MDSEETLKELEMLTKLEKADEFIEILKPLEAIVLNFYALAEYETLVDFDVLTVYEALAKVIKAKLTNYPIPQHRLNADLAGIYDYLLKFLEGKEEAYTLEEIQAAIKMVIKSSKKWSELHGSRGYLRLISRFF